MEIPKKQHSLNIEVPSGSFLLLRRFQSHPHSENILFFFFFFLRKQEKEKNLGIISLTVCALITIYGISDIVNADVVKIPRAYNETMTSSFPHPIISKENGAFSDPFFFCFLFLAP